MKRILCLISLFLTVKALSSIPKLQDAYDSIYVYDQNVTIFIEEQKTSDHKTKFEVAIRKSATDPKALVGVFRNYKIESAVNSSEADIESLKSPFKAVLSNDGLMIELWTKTGETLFGKKVKTSVLKLLLQNATEINEYLAKNEKNIVEEKCQEVTTVSQTDKEYIFETVSKQLDCNGVSSLQGVASDKTQFKVFYHLTKADKSLQRTESITNVVYLTTVAARFETLQTLEFRSFDGLLSDIDESVLVEKSTSDDIAKFFEGSQ